MNQKYFKNSITAILITSFLLMPLAAIPKKAEAQSFGGYVSGLAPAIAVLPLCKGKIKVAVASLFGGTNAALIANLDASRDAFLQNTIGNTAAEGVIQATAIETNSPTANAKLEEIRIKTNQTQKTVESIDASKTCLDSIGRLVVKMLLQKLTVSTVNWINSGFDGKPAFIQDPGKFFKDIAKNEILQFGLEINNPELFPFGKQWLKNQALAYNNKFADNARYSLDEMIRSTTPQYSAQSFQTDFSMGGWDAWTAMTQVPANNPLGFQLLASDELNKRLAGTGQSTAQNVRDALKEANGFLGDQRCKTPKDLTRQQHEAGLIARNNGEDNALICTEWEYVTPGKLIAEAATNAVGYPKDSLLNVDTLNDAVAAVLDALLNRFSSTIMKKGFASLGDEGADGRFIYDPNSARTDYGSSQTAKDFTPIQLTSSWLAANPYFNIRTDLSQALVDEQRTYSDKLKEQNKELNSTTDGKDFRIGSNGVSNAYGLIPTINQLDYCIPGPHPSWEEDSRRTLDAVTNLIRPITLSDVENETLGSIIGAAQSLAPLAGAAIGASIGTAAFPVVGTIVGAAVGTLLSFAFNLFGGDPQKTLRAFYSSQIQTLTGVGTDFKNDESEVVGSLLSKQGAVQALNTMLERYIIISHTVYNSRILPTVYKEAANQYNKREGYGQIMLNNEDKIFTVKNTVITLGEIKSEVDLLNVKRESGQITDEEYETQLKPQINAFGRLSAKMVNGDDIASADDLTKQIIDQKTYIYKDLLKGPFGCEKDLELARQGMSTQLYNTKRMDYPFPTLYTYDVPAGGNIPDPYPLISGLVVPNKTNINATATLGPGFLSFYAFQKDGKAPKPNDPFPSTGPDRIVPPCVADPATGTVPWCELKLVDVVPINDNTGGQPANRKLRQLGKTPTPASGPFEYSIGVY